MSSNPLSPPEDDSEKDGYTCHRIQPLFKPESSLDDPLNNPLNNPLGNQFYSNQTDTQSISTTSRLLKSVAQITKKSSVTKSTDANVTKANDLGVTTKISDASPVEESEQESTTGNKDVDNNNPEGGVVGIGISALTASVVGVGKAPLEPSAANNVLGGDLFNIVREACAQQNVKWPVECQVCLRL